MSKLLRTALLLLGTGLFSGLGMSLFKWGPCGPSSIWGLICMLIAIACLTVGSIFVIAALLKALVNRIRLAVPSQRG